MIKINSKENRKDNEIEILIESNDKMQKLYWIQDILTQIMGYACTNILKDTKDFSMVHIGMFAEVINKECRIVSQSLKESDKIDNSSISLLICIDEYLNLVFDLSQLFQLFLICNDEDENSYFATAKFYRSFNELIQSLSFDYHTLWEMYRAIPKEKLAGLSKETDILSDKSTQIEKTSNKLRETMLDSMKKEGALS